MTISDKFFFCLERILFLLSGLASHLHFSCLSFLTAGILGVCTITTLHLCYMQISSSNLSLSRFPQTWGRSDASFKAMVYSRWHFELSRFLIYIFFLGFSAPQVLRDRVMVPWHPFPFPTSWSRMPFC